MKSKEETAQSFSRKTRIVNLLLFLGLFIFSLGLTNLRAEDAEWVQMWRSGKFTIYEVKQAFDTHFKQRNQGRGTGYKQFLRWYNFMEPRLYPSGRMEQLDPALAWREVAEFKSCYPSKMRATWVALGPTKWQDLDGHWSPGNGRIDVICKHPTDDNILYAGAPSGGLWRTTDGGANWVTLTDNIPVLGISGIAIDHTNPNIVYISTGDKDHVGTYSVGVLKSTDSGVSWNTTGFSYQVSQKKRPSKLIMHPTKANILFLGTPDGLYKTSDSAATWKVVQSGNIDDMEFKPGSPTTVYACSETSQFYKSTNEGESFSLVTVSGASGRGQIAVTAANANYVYLASASGGFYRSTDSGATFTRRGNNGSSGSSAWYMWSLAASHTNAEEVHFGEMETYKTTNGGTSWTQTSVWTYPNSTGYIHCDIHEMIFYGGTLYVGSDGLIAKTTNGATTWTILNNNICTTQIYRIGLAKTNANKYIYGAQDNGTYYYDGSKWVGWLGADGMECMFDSGNESIHYGTTQNGNWYAKGVTITQPGTGGWVTPAVMHPTNPATIYVGTSSVKKTTNRMSSWTTVGTFGSGNIAALAIAPSNPSYLYASKAGQIWRTKNDGGAWTEVTTGLPSLSITYISVSYNNPEKIVVTLSGYTSGQKVYKSENAGTTWTNISYALPNLPANCAVFQNNTKDGLYVGMDVGVYYIDNTLTAWQSYFNGLPNVVVLDMEIHEGSGKLRAGTYGRGLWETTLYSGSSITANLTYSVAPSTTAVYFTDTSTSQGCTIVKWEWNFGDGTTSTLPNPIHTYAAAGTYTVTLKVTCDDGTTATISKVITIPPIISSKDIFVCSFPGLGLWLWDPNTGVWTKINTLEPTQIAVGDIDGNGKDDLVGSFTVGLWIRLDSGIWQKIEGVANPNWLTVGDADGDGKHEVMGVWQGIGVWAYYVNLNKWERILEKDAVQITSGDFDKDGKDEVLGWWDPEGLWVYDVADKKWTKVLDKTNLVYIYAGDPNGDGKDEALGSWTFGIYYYDLITTSWTKLFDSSAVSISTGDLNGQSKDDLMGIWSSVAGIWVRYTEDGSWYKIHDTKPACYAAGKLK